MIVSVEKFLKQRAVTIAVDGNYTLHRWYDPKGKLRTYACRTTRVSPFRMIVEVPVVGRIGDRLTSYFGAFGQLEGCISDTMHGSFLLELEMTRARRERLSEQLTWLEKKQSDPTLLDQRGDVRSIPQNPQSTLTLADGSIHSCFIIDMSVSGAAVSAELELPIGTPLAVGACVGRVVRIFPEGFAIRFVERRGLDEINRLIVRTEPKPSGPAPAAPLLLATGEP
jgi:PilZ domain